MSSELIPNFLRRVQLLEASIDTSEQAIAFLVRKTRMGFRGEFNAQRVLAHFQRRRKIGTIELVDSLGHDGELVPVGKSYESGFEVRLEAQQSPARRNFTLAHEICHSYFYEITPEHKFRVHECDPLEERLCDFGAAEVLIPASRLERSSFGRPICLVTLRELASEYSVTASAMFLRLRKLRLWDGAYSEWFRMRNGSFALENLLGYPEAGWSWDDPSILEDVWRTDQSLFSNTSVAYVDVGGVRRARAVAFEASRRGDKIVALWGPHVRPPLPPKGAVKQLGFGTMPIRYS